MERRTLLRTGVLAGTALLSLPTAFAAALPAPAGAALDEAKLIYVATQRSDGSVSEASPIWFQRHGEDELFFTTSPDSWKAKRIEGGSPLFIWVGAPDGPFLVGKAERVTDEAFVEEMGERYEDKYWIAWMGLFRPRGSRVAAGKTNAYRVQLREGTPPGAPAH